MQLRLGGVAGARSTLFRPLKKQLQGLSFSLRIIYIACLSDLKANIFPNPNPVPKPMRRYPPCHVGAAPNYNETESIP
jgi:hypothetical protein